MSFETLQLRLSALQETNTQIEELIHRLGTLKFQPGSIPLEGSDGDVSQELSEEISELMKEQAEELEILELEVGDLPAGNSRSSSAAVSAAVQERSVLIGGVNRANEVLRKLRTSFRHAQLAAKAAITEAQRTERALLLSSIVAPPPIDETEPAPRYTSLFQDRKATPVTKEDKELNASSNVTLALRRTQALLSSELSRSQFAHETLRESSAALNSVSDTYSDLNTMLQESRQFLGTLLKSQKSDTWYLQSAFYLLVGTIAWLIFRRWVYGPAWWLLYFPLRMTWRAWMNIFTAIGLRGGAEVALKSSASSAIMHTMPEVVMSATEVPTMQTNSRGEQEREDNMDGGSLIEEVGRVVDGETVNEEVVVEGNPKKRMWEENTDPEKEAVKSTAKDEL